MDLKDTIEASNSPKNELKEITLYQLVAPNGECVGEPKSSANQVLQDDYVGEKFRMESYENYLVRILKQGYRVIEVAYIPKS